jgi:dihydroflavonol-4-reductase
LTGAVLVTGASGFLGRPLVRALQDAGRPAIALCRRPEALADLQGSALRIVSGDLRDPSSYRPLLREVSSVFHLAAARNRPAVRVRELEAVNERATLELARHAGEAGVARLVNVATALIYGPAEGREKTEEDGISPRDLPGAYERSRAIAALELRRMARQEGLPALTVCPAIVYGPDHPSRLNRVTSEIRRLLQRRPAVLVGGGRRRRNLVYVDDVVRGLLAAERLGRPGEEYILGGGEVTHRELAGLVRDRAGLRGGSWIPLPAWMALAAARAADRGLGYDAGGGFVTAVRNLLCEWRFSSAKASRELGFRPLSVAEGVGRTIDWIRGMEDR